MEEIVRRSGRVPLSIEAHLDSERHRLLLADSYARSRHLDISVRSDSPLPVTFLQPASMLEGLSLKIEMGVYSPRVRGVELPAVFLGGSAPSVRRVKLVHCYVPWTPLCGLFPHVTHLEFVDPNILNPIEFEDFIRALSSMPHLVYLRIESDITQDPGSVSPIFRFSSLPGSTDNDGGGLPIGSERSSQVVLPNLTRLALGPVLFSTCFRAFQTLVFSSLSNLRLSCHEFFPDTSTDGPNGGVVAERFMMSHFTNYWHLLSRLKPMVCLQVTFSLLDDSVIHKFKHSEPCSGTAASPVSATCGDDLISTQAVPTLTFITTSRRAVDALLESILSHDIRHISFRYELPYGCGPPQRRRTLPYHLPEWFTSVKLSGIERLDVCCSLRALSHFLDSLHPSAAAPYPATQILDIPNDSSQDVYNCFPKLRTLAISVLEIRDKSSLREPNPGKRDIFEVFFDSLARLCCPKQAEGSRTAIPHCVLPNLDTVQVHIDSSEMNSLDRRAVEEVVDACEAAWAMSVLNGSTDGDDGTLGAKGKIRLDIERPPIQYQDLPVGDWLDIGRED